MEPLKNDAVNAVWAQLAVPVKFPIKLPLNEPENEPEFNTNELLVEFPLNNCKFPLLYDADINAFGVNDAV